jgi:hypothetical protein
VAPVFDRRKKVYPSGRATGTEGCQAFHSTLPQG